MKHARGMYGLTCWNGLSAEQQTRLVIHGNLPIGYHPKGDCPNGAEVEVVTDRDTAPGPRFYCYACAIKYLKERMKSEQRPLRTVRGLEETDPRRPIQRDAL
jgi:hypothetical protein